MKQGSIVAMGACDDKPDYDYADGVELRLYELQNDETVTKCVYAMDQSKDLEISAVKTEGKITIDVQANKAYTIRLVNVTGVSVEGASVRVEGNDTVLTPSAPHMVVVL